MSSTAAPETRRSLAGGALLAAGARIVVVVAGAVVTVIVARVLGPSGSGHFAVITSLAFVLMAVATVGFEAGISWLVGGRRWDPSAALATSVLVALAFGAAAAGIGFGIYEVARGSAFAGIDAEVALLTLCSLPPALLVVFFSQIALSSERYEAVAAISLAQSAAYVVGVAALASAFDLEGAATGLLAGQLAGALTALVWSRRVLPAAGGARRVDIGRLREAIAFGVKLWIANAAAILLYRFDLLLLNAYSGSTEAGYYAVAIATTTALGVLPAALGAVLFPRLASLSDTGDEPERRATEDRAIRHTLLVLLASSALLAIALPLLVKPVFGPEFGPAVVPALILIPGAAALGVAATLYSALAGRGRPEYAMWAALAVTPAAIALYFVLVPALEAEGAALGSDAAYLASAGLAALALRRVSGPRPLRTLLPGRAELRDYAVLGRQLRHRTGRA